MSSFTKLPKELLGHLRVSTFRERGDRVLRVVYNASVDPPRIVTVYFDRRQRGKT